MYRQTCTACGIPLVKEGEEIDEDDSFQLFPLLVQLTLFFNYGSITLNAIVLFLIVVLDQIG